jgi:Flp pilus assembly protein TadG
MRRFARRGAAALEFALTLPVFLALLFAIVDLSLYFFHLSSLDLATRAACRAASRAPAPAEAEAREVFAATLSRAGSACGECALEVRAFGEAPLEGVACMATRPLAPVLGLSVRPVTLRARASAHVDAP